MLQCAGVTLSHDDTCIGLRDLSGFRQARILFKSGEVCQRDSTTCPPARATLSPIGELMMAVCKSVNTVSASSKDRKADGG